MSKLRLASVIALLLVALALPVLALQKGQQAPNFQLKDQFGKIWKLSDLKGKVVILVAADQHSGESMGPWVEKLKKRYGGKAQILGLLGLQDIPSVGRGIAKSRIKDETNDPLMLDFDGKTAKSYEVSSKQCCVVCIDKNSVVRHVSKSICSDGAWKSASAAIDAVVK